MSSGTSTGSPPGPNVMVHVFPKPGKESRVEELIVQASDQVRVHEPWISLYRYYRVKRDVSDAEYIIVFQ
ncbi:hypothetical protein G647_07694 [Cladophialophora carrionii CBS 160.54]|uniref:ABM domain-containing protein n=1 Tax=Cladophialophora carrionii CBS 160.54 TaxID=1279043 RepID=V9D4X3_9EURO|nr:uncharacterized protein G647_07694 [Cladophialophora carrionii CBS 160.54]ETI21348.1 hypothetical protein G647_07694 [Cladophialophora carrionii CBS 160.54]